MKALWLTDLHLPFVSHDKVTEFFHFLKSHSPGCVFVGGDTGESSNFGEYLEDLQSIVSAPVYFVLGNHDFYKGSFQSVHYMAEEVTT